MGMGMSSKLARLAFVSGWLMFASALHAEPTAADKATAQALFDHGKQLAAAGQLSEACSKFEESQRLDPGIGTQFHLASCYEQAGRTASAWTLFLEVASGSHAQGQLEREKVAERAPPRFRPSCRSSPSPFRTPAELLGSKSNAMACRSGRPVGPLLPLDPGDHTVTASAPRKQAWQTAIRLPPNGVR